MSNVTKRGCDSQGCTACDRQWFLPEQREVQRDRSIERGQGRGLASAAPTSGQLAPPTHQVQPTAASTNGVHVAEDPVVVGTHSLTSFPVALVLLLHFVTLGIFTPFWLGYLHGKLPKLRENDPSRGQGVWYLLIPGFSLYWVFFSTYRLSIRLNEQLAAAGRRERVPVALGITGFALCFVPFVNWVSLLVLLPVFAWIVQARVNALAEDATEQRQLEIVRRRLPAAVPPSARECEPRPTHGTNGKPKIEPPEHGNRPIVAAAQI